VKCPPESNLIGGDAMISDLNIESLFWSVNARSKTIVAKIFGKSIYFPKSVVGLEKCLEFIGKVFGSTEVLSEEVETAHIKVYGRDTSGGYVVTLDCEKDSDHLGLNINPDWSSGSIYSRLPKTVDGLIRALPDLK